MIETAPIYAFIIANQAIIVFAIQACVLACVLVVIVAIELALFVLICRGLIALKGLCDTVAGTLRHVLFGLPKYVESNPEVNLAVEPSLDLEVDLLEEPEPVLPEYVDADKYQPEYEPPPYSGKASSLNIVYTMNKKWSAYQHEQQISKIFDLPAYDEADLQENVSISPGGN